jgi:bla regulator protein blaR1
MDFIQNLLPENLTFALGWTVVHSLWQGVIVAALLVFVLYFLRHKKAKTRYQVSVTALFLMFGVSVFTFVSIIESVNRGGQIDENMALILRGIVSSQSIDNQSFMQSVLQFFSQNLSFIVLIWLVGIAFFALRMMGGLMYVEILKTRHLTPLSIDWQSKMNLYKNQLAIPQKVQLLESALITIPMTIGWLKPLILLPIGAVNGMSTQQVEAIIAHELAHIAGRDYLLNIVQTTIEILFYYHPAVWFISANIRMERENRCDDVAVALCGNSLTYAKALLAIQEMQHQNIRTYGLAMTFSTNRKGLLLNRIKRILNQPQNRNNIMEKLFATALLVIAVSAFAFTDTQQNPTTPLSEATPPQYLTTKSPLDTIPNEEENIDEFTISTVKKGKKVYLRKENGEVKELKINGKRIEKEDYAKYSDLIVELSVPPPAPPTPPSAWDVPAPPAPPTAPASPSWDSDFNVPTPPTPPTPPSGVPPAPPKPPKPPKAPRFGFFDDKDSDGHSTWHFDKGNRSITIEDGTIYLDGKKVDTTGLPKLKKYDAFPWGNSGFLNVPEVWQFDKEILTPFNNFNFDDKMVFKIDPKIMIDRMPKGLYQERQLYPDFNGSLFDGQNHEFFQQDSFPNKWYNMRDSEEYKKYNEKLDKLRKEKSELNKKMRDESDKLKEKTRSLQREYQEKFRSQNDSIRRQSQELSRERMQLFKENFGKKDQGNFYKNGKNINKQIEDALKKDGLIDKDAQKYNFELTDKHLIINGLEHPKEVFEKYRRFYEALIGSSINGMQFKYQKNE